MLTTQDVHIHSEPFCSLCPLIGLSYTAALPKHFCIVRFLTVVPKHFTKYMEADKSWKLGLSKPGRRPSRA